MLNKAYFKLCEACLRRLSNSFRVCMTRYNEQLHQCLGNVHAEYMPEAPVLASLHNRTKQ